MSEDIQRLKEIGASKIHADTHIALGHIKAIFEENYESLNRVQFLGFVSILEREYRLNLSDLKNQINEYYVKKPLIVGKNQNVFTISKSKPKTAIKAIYVVMALVLFVIGIFVSLNYSSQDSIVTTENDIIEKVKKNIKAKAEILKELSPVIVPIISESENAELNTSLKEESKIDKLIEQREENITELSVVTPVVVVEEIISKKKEEKAQKVKVFSDMEVKKLIISPRSKVWIGYINLKTRKKSQKVIKNSITLRENYLIVLGHSSVRFKINEEKVTYKTKGNLRLLFKDGKLKKISLKEFKALNRGRKW